MTWMKGFTGFVRPVMLCLMLWSHSAQAFDPCKGDTIIHHKPRADVTYTPQDEAHTAGMTVFPVQIPLTLDLAERYGLEVPAGTDLNAGLGMIEIDETGKVFYNGKELSSDIKDLCNTHDSSSPENPSSENGDLSDTGGKLP